MAVPKKFKFKKKKLNFNNINNNNIYIKPFFNKYYFKDLKFFLTKKNKKYVILIKIFFIFNFY